MKKVTAIITAIAIMFAVSCSKTEMEPQTGVNDGQDISAARHGIPNIDAYYDEELFTINLMELSEQAAESIIAHNQKKKNCDNY